MFRTKSSPIWVITFLFYFLITAQTGFTEEIETLDVEIGSSSSSPPSTSPSPPKRVSRAWTADPFTRMEEDMRQMESRLDSLFDQNSLLSQNMLSTPEKEHWYEEKDGQILLYFQIEDAVPDSLDINVTANNVSIQGVSREEKETVSSQGSFYSSSESSFYKQFPLRPDADPKNYSVNTTQHQVIITFERKAS